MGDPAGGSHWLSLPLRRHWSTTTFRSRQTVGRRWRSFIGVAAYRVFTGGDHAVLKSSFYSLKRTPLFSVSDSAFIRFSTSRGRFSSPTTTTTTTAFLPVEGLDEHIIGKQCMIQKVLPFPFILRTCCLVSIAEVTRYWATSRIWTGL